MLWDAANLLRPVFVQLEYPIKEGIKMGINFNFAKKFAAEQIIKQAMHYLEKDPEKNLIKVLNLADKIARTEQHHIHITNIKKSYQTNPALLQFVRRLTRIAPSYRDGMFMNFFLNASLMGVPWQYELA